MSSEPVNIFSEADASGEMTLRLHVAGDAPNSVAAHANLMRIVQMHPGQVSSVEIVDCLTDPGAVLEDSVLVTPTLIRLSPEPKIRIVGDLRNYDYVARALGLRG